MFDTHESPAVRHTGQLISQQMGYFLDELMELLFDLPEEDERRETPWFKLLSAGSSEWKQNDLDTCYLFVLMHHWQHRYIKPPAEVMFTCLYQLSTEEAEYELKSWCALDDRHIDYAEALEWSKSDECQDLVANYLKEFSQKLETEKYYLDEEDIFSHSTPNEEISLSYLRYQELISLKNKWRFIAEQIKYVDTLAPDITLSTKLYWLQVALVSQPITEIFGKKKSYEAAILREKELLKKLSV